MRCRKSVCMHQHAHTYVTHANVPHISICMCAQTYCRYEVSACRLALLRVLARPARKYTVNLSAICVHKNMPKKQDTICMFVCMCVCACMYMYN